MTDKLLLRHRTLGLYLETPTEFVNGISYLTGDLSKAYRFSEIPDKLQMVSPFPIIKIYAELSPVA